MKIIYIVGDGRSGSTILDSIIGNANNSISVGECGRFWFRYYKKDTLCGCSEKIESCLLWSNIENSIKDKFPKYNHKLFAEKVRYILYFRTFKKIPNIVNNKEWREFCDIVIHFYKTISKTTNKHTIIDSTKYPNWGYFLDQLNFCEIQIIHLERNIQSVANSWKKKKLLPEYYNKEVFMPIKNNFTILKSWLKVKYLSKKLSKNSNYIFINYESFCKNPNITIDQLSFFLNIKINNNELIMPFNHSIGGNPVRSTNDKIIKIKNLKVKYENLNNFEIIFFSCINTISKVIIK